MSIHTRNYSNNPMETKVAIDEKGPHYYPKDYGNHSTIEKREAVTIDSLHFHVSQNIALTSSSILAFTSNCKSTVEIKE